MFRLLRCLVLLLPAMLFGCGDGSSNNSGQIPAPAISLSSSSATVAPGQSATYALALQGGNLPASPIVLSVTGLPSGATATFDPPQVALANTTLAGSSTLTVATGASTPVGTYTLSIQGLVGNTTFGVATATLNVQTGGTGNFTLQVTPSSATVGSSTPATFNITVTTSGGFLNPITLSVSGGGTNFIVSNPSPAVLNFSGTQTVASATFTVSRIVGSTSTVPQTLTVTATGGSVTQTATVTVQSP